LEDRIAQILADRFAGQISNGLRHGPQLVEQLPRRQIGLEAPLDADPLVGRQLVVEVRAQEFVVER
jgi:hypothetical protein